MNSDDVRMVDLLQHLKFTWKELFQEIGRRFSLVDELASKFLNGAVDWILKSRLHNAAIASLAKSFSKRISSSL